MRAVFKIEDERHAEPQSGEYLSLAAALAELRRLAEIPWDQPPNAAPCSSSHECGRTYEVVEYDVSVRPWKELRRVTALEIDARGVRWASPDIERLGLQ